MILLNGVLERAKTGDSKVRDFFGIDKWLQEIGWNDLRDHFEHEL